MSEPSIVVIARTSARDTVDEAIRVRAGGDVPLVLDDRWGADRVAAVEAFVATPARLTPARPCSYAGDGSLPGQAAWATLTSGSSSTARIVLRTDESWSASFAAIEGLAMIGRDDVVYLPSPPCSSLSMFSVAHSIARGFDLALPTAHTVAASDFEHSTVVHSTPSVLLSVVEHLESGARSRLHTALVGGSHVPAGLVARAAAQGIQAVSYYGAAELSFVAVDAGDGLRAFPGVSLEVRDGELWVRSPFAALGYLGEGGALQRDGEWMSVGDLARIDDGRVSIVGRADGAILSASATIIPRDVEVVIESVPGVREAVVVGLPHARIGQLVAAVVESSAPPSIAELRAATVSLLPSHRPRRWFSVTKLPRTSTGKVARSELLALIESGELVAHA